MRFILLNALPGVRAGSVIDTEQGQRLSQITSVGGKVLQLPNATAEAAAELATRAYARGAGDEIATGIMLSSCSASLTLAGGGGLLWKPSGGGDAKTWDDVMVLVESQVVPPVIWTIPNESYSIPGNLARYGLRRGFFRSPVGEQSIVNIEDGATLLDCAGSYGSILLQGNSTSDANPSFDWSEFTSGSGEPGIWISDLGGGYWKQQGSAPMAIIPDNRFMVYAQRYGGGIDPGSVPGEVFRLGAFSVLLWTSVGQPSTNSPGFITGPATATIGVQHDGNGREIPPATIPAFLGGQANLAMGQDGGAGSTAFRPAGFFNPLVDGIRYWDTTLFKALWWEAAGMQWRDSQGVVVPLVHVHVSTPTADSVFRGRTLTSVDGCSGTDRRVRLRRAARVEGRVPPEEDSRGLVSTEAIVKRVLLVPPGGRAYAEDLSLLIDPDVLRAVAVALSRFAVDAPEPGGRSVGDSIHEWVTEGRRREYEVALARGAEWAKKMVPYSSCGDLAHWLLACLGCRDERYVNRTDDAGEIPWKAALNITRLQQLPSYIRAVAAKGRLPKPGDIIHVAAPDHVAVVEDWDDVTGEVTSDDYGQPYGKQRMHPILRRGGTILIGTRVLQGWVDLEGVPLKESAYAPDDFEGAMLDENPYLDDLRVPPGV